MHSVISKSFVFLVSSGLFASVAFADLIPEDSSSFKESTWNLPYMLLGNVKTCKLGFVDPGTGERKSIEGDIVQRRNERSLVLAAFIGSYPYNIYLGQQPTDLDNNVGSRIFLLPTLEDAKMVNSKKATYAGGDSITSTRYVRSVIQPNGFSIITLNNISLGWYSNYSGGGQVGPEVISADLRCE